VVRQIEQSSRIQLYSSNDFQRSWVDSSLGFSMESVLNAHRLLVLELIYCARVKFDDLTPRLWASQHLAA